MLDGLALLLENFIDWILGKLPLPKNPVLNFILQILVIALICAAIAGIGCLIALVIQQIRN